MIVNQLPPKDILKLQELGLIALPKEDIQTLKDISNLHESKRPSPKEFDSEEDENETEQLTESFTAKDREGRPLGPSIGKIRELVAAQDVSMENIRNKDLALYRELEAKYGTEVKLEHLSPSELLRLEEMGVVALPEKARKTLLAAKKLEKHQERQEKRKANLFKDKEPVRLHDLEQSDPGLY